MASKGAKWYSDEQLAKMSPAKREAVLKKKAISDNQRKLAAQLDWSVLQKTPIPWRGPCVLKGEKTFYGVMSLNFFIMYKNGGKEPAGVKDKGFFPYEKIITMQSLESASAITMHKDNRSLILKKKPVEGQKSNEWVIKCEDNDAAAHLMRVMLDVAAQCHAAWNDLVEMSPNGDSYALFESIKQACPRKFKLDTNGEASKQAGVIKTLTEAILNARQYQGISQKMKYFHEYYNEKTSEYINWVSGSGPTKSTDGGQVKMLEAVEATLCKHWKQWIRRAAKDLPQFRHERFFYDDLKEVIEKGQNAITIYEGMKDYRKRLWNDADAFVEDVELEMKIVRPWTRYFELLPKVSQLPLKTLGSVPGFPRLHPLTPGEGKIEQYLGMWERWRWYLDRDHPNLPEQYILMCDSHKQERPYWYCRDAAAMRSIFHGTVLWNRSSWVWTHPKIKFLVRYVWDARNRVFRFCEGRQEHWVFGNWKLPDWRFDAEKNGLVPIINDTVKQDFHAFRVLGGSVPAPVLLTCAMTMHIHTTIIDVMNHVEDLPGDDDDDDGPQEVELEDV